MATAMIEFEGRLGGDPELRFTPSGAAVVNLTVAVQGRKKDGDRWVDGDTSWFRVTAWKKLAENIADSLAKGDPVFVRGRQEQRTWETQDGEKKTAYDVTADLVAVPLTFKTVQIQSAERSSSRSEPSAEYPPDEEPFF